MSVGGLPLSLTASGGALIMGLVFGWLRSVRPTFGRIPEPALWVFDTIGLAVFIGVVGLSAGPSFVAGLAQMGPSLLVVGFIVAVTPHVAALLFGRYVLKMNPVILFGACSGAGTVTAALRSIQDEAREQAPRPRLHRAVRHRQHPAHRVGPRHRHADQVGELHHVEATVHRSVVDLAAACVAGRGGRRLRRAAGGAKPALPTIVVLATGGTIAGAAASDVQAGYTSGQVGVDQLLAAVPQAKKLANLRGEQISNIGSQDMNDEVWLKLATRVNELVAMPDVAGVVITHGTDTIEETAYFLNLVVKSKKPVVLTASMRPSTALSADGPLNFFNAVAVAANKDAAGRGVLVVDQRLDPRRVVAHEDEHDGGADVHVAAARPDRHRGLRRGRVLPRARRARTPSTSEFSLDGVTALPRVDIIMAYENMDGALIDAAVAAGAKGIVIAGVGNGNLTSPAVEGARRAGEEGRRLRPLDARGDGLVGRNVELDDDELGFVASLGLNPQKSRVLLRLALTKTKDLKEIQRYFIQY